MIRSRRDFVRTSLGIVAMSPFAFAEEPARSGFPGLVVRSTEPRNLEFPVSELRGSIIPNEHFFVRSHFAVPAMDAKTWRLKIEGAVNSPIEINYDDLLRLPSRTETVTLECAGNGRVALTPPVPGLQWGQGAVGNAE